MKIERTPTYTRWYIGRWYITKTRKNESEEVFIYLIENQAKLTDRDLQQCIDYLTACQESLIKRK